ncbi:UNVERIFIED_CONTAM: hypothetical protein Slati_0513800 [Sesamum latifolium]|uniref:SWIM-type domain-containing protein n=1 Tax=Sesamum latifolium TaxID=2727402 RepID=A0AAW2Y083_9LAMI
MQLNREKAEKWDGVICPNIKKILLKIEKEAGECIPMRSDEWNFQIVGPFDQHTVNVLQRTCSCRKWDLSGIPCRHAVSAIWCRNEEPEAYVHKYYSIEAYKKCYEFPIFGVNSSDLWPRSMNEPPLPPLYKEKVGRPQRMRRREPNEPPAPTSNPFRLVGVKRKNKCKSCEETNHNSATCKRRRFDNRDTGTETAAIPVEASQSQQPDAPQFSSQPTQASASNEPAQNRGTRQKLPVRMPLKNKQTKPTRSTRIASVKINQSTSNVHTPVIVRGGMNFITLSNLRASFSNTATGNTSRLASELPPGVSRSTSRMPSSSSTASQSSQQG